MELNIYHDRKMMEQLAIHNAKEHGCNYNVILMNPIDGKFGDGSTYEFVADSYFEKERPNTILLDTTDNLIPKEANEGLLDDDKPNRKFDGFDGFDEAIDELNSGGKRVVKKKRAIGISTSMDEIERIFEEEDQRLKKDSIFEITDPHPELREYGLPPRRGRGTPVVRNGEKLSHQRNKPCPLCDSGKKYKNCCINKHKD